MKTSYGEKLLRAFIKRSFPNNEIIHNFREAGIINPNTGRQLEIDIYIPKLKLGFEFNGIQHRTDLSQRERDKIKRREAKKLGITLITIWTSSIEGDLYNFIKERLPKGIVMKKPNSSFNIWFKEKTKEYKTNIYKMNKRLKK